MNISTKEIFVKEFLTNMFGTLLSRFQRFTVHNHKLKMPRCPAINKRYTFVQHGISQIYLCRSSLFGGKAD